MNALLLCRFDDGVLHVRPSDPAGRAPCYDVHSMSTAPLCATPGGHPIGRDVAGDVEQVIELRGRGVCHLCARAARERLEAAREAARASAPAAWRPEAPRARTQADVVIALRLALRVSQAGLARRLGTTQTVVSWWETGKHHPSRMSWMAMRGLAAGGGDECEKVLREIDALKEARDDRS